MAPRLERRGTRLRFDLAHASQALAAANCDIEDSTVALLHRSRHGRTVRGALQRVKRKPGPGVGPAARRKSLANWRKIRAK
jgi:hypothetical protein